MAYTNPLHSPLSIPSYSSYSSLGEAMNSTPTPSQFVSPYRRRLPQAPYTPSSKWKNAIGRSNHLQSPITFDYLGYSKQGISMDEVRTRGIGALLRMIQGPDDLVLAHTDLERINLRIIVSCSYTYVIAVQKNSDQKRFPLFFFFTGSGLDMRMLTGRVVLMLDPMVRSRVPSSPLTFVRSSVISQR